MKESFITIHFINQTWVKFVRCYDSHHKSRVPQFQAFLSFLNIIFSIPFSLFLKIFIPFFRDFYMLKINQKLLLYFVPLPVFKTHFHKFNSLVNVLMFL